MPGTFVAGKFGQIRVNGTSLNLRRWSITPQTQPIDVANFNSQGYDEDITGFLGGDVDVEGLYDSAVNPYASPVLLKPGQYVTVFLGITSLIGWTVTGWVLSTPQNNDVRQAVSFSAKIKVNGVIQFPGGA